MPRDNGDRILVVRTRWNAGPIIRMKQIKVNTNQTELFFDGMK